MTDSKKNVKSEKIRRWFEPIGLFLLLAAFGWQCLDEQSQQMKMEGYLYETNEKLQAIWEGVYDEALHSERYNGKATVVVNYDAVNDHFKDWNEVKMGMSTLENRYICDPHAKIQYYFIGGRACQQDYSFAVSAALLFSLVLCSAILNSTFSSTRNEQRLPCLFTLWSFQSVLQKKVSNTSCSSKQRG